MALVFLVVPGTVLAGTARDVGPSHLQVGRVETVAGPGYCAGDAIVDQSSLRVGAMAVSQRRAPPPKGSDEPDDTGVVHFDIGSPRDGRVARVNGDGRAAVLTARVDGREDAGRLAADAGGGVFVAAEDRVLRLNAGVTPVAGGAARPTEASSGNGDGGPALEATFGRVASVAADDSGNLYVADEVDRVEGAVRIRFANLGAVPVTFYPGTPSELTVPPGVIDSVAGDPGGSPDDGVAARTARLIGRPPAMAVAGSLLYLALYEPVAKPQPRARVRVVNFGGSETRVHGSSVAASTIRTVAGRGAIGFEGDGGPALRAAFSELPGIAVDTPGNLYLADRDHHRVRRVDRDGVITTFAGSGDVGPGDGGFNGNGRPAPTARLDTPVDVKTAPGGFVLISDSGNGQVRFVDSAGTIHSSFGNGVGRMWRCVDGSGPGATVGVPKGFAKDGAGDVYVLIAGLHGVKRITSSGTVETVVAAPGDGGAKKFVSASLSDPGAIAATPDGALYVLDGGTRVRLVNPRRRAIRANGVTVPPGSTATIAGNGVSGHAGDGGRAALAQLSTGAAALAADARGNLYVADGDRVRMVDRSGRITTVVAAGAEPGSGRCCPLPDSLAVDAAGNLYVGDEFSGVVWYVNLGQRRVLAHGKEIAPKEAVVIAGKGGHEVVGTDGPNASMSDLGSPMALAPDGRGSLYVAAIVGGQASVDHSVRKIDAAGAISTVVGGGAQFFNGDGLDARLTMLAFPRAVAVDRCGNLLVADSTSDRVRRVRLVASCISATPTAVPSERWLKAWLALATLLACAAVPFVLPRHVAPRHS